MGFPQPGMYLNMYIPLTLFGSSNRNILQLITAFTQSEQYIWLHLIYLMERVELLSWISISGTLR